MKRRSEEKEFVKRSSLHRREGSHGRSLGSHGRSLGSHGRSFQLVVENTAARAALTAVCTSPLLSNATYVTSISNQVLPWLVASLLVSQTTMDIIKASI